MTTSLSELMGFEVPGDSPSAPADEGDTIEWRNLIRSLEEWPLKLLPLYEFMGNLIDPWRGDPLLEREWSACLDLLDRHPMPASVEIANQVVRDFVDSFWRMYSNVEARQRKERRARALLKEAGTT